MPESGVSRDDLRAAVASGVLDEAQATRLIALADQRQGYRANMIGDDEPFELFKGFAEIFVTVGLCLLIAGFVGLFALFEAGLIPILLMGLSVGLAFYFTRKRRMSLPSIALAIAFAVSLTALLMILVYEGLDTPAPPQNAIIVGVIGMLAMLGYYKVFRLPFSMFLVGIFGIFLMTGLVDFVSPGVTLEIKNLTDFFDLRSSPILAVGTLIFGLCAFVLAIWFDMKDPHRVSRYSSTAFWLHLLAAPAMVNTLVMSNYQMGGMLGTSLAVAALLLFTLLAIIIDRRSFLTAGLIYMGLLIAGAIADTGTDWAPVLTLLALGAFVTTLGAFWTQMRALIMGALPDFPGKGRLPPYSDGLAVPE